MKKILILAILLVSLSKNAFAGYYKIFNNQTTNANSSQFHTLIPYNGSFPTLFLFGTKGAATISLQAKDPATNSWATSETDELDDLGLYTTNYNPEVPLRLVISGADGSTNISAIIFGGEVQ